MLAQRVVIPFAWFLAIPTIPVLGLFIYLALWQYLWVERPVQDSAPWKSPRAGVSPTRLRGQFEAQLSEQNMEAAARQHFA